MNPAQVHLALNHIPVVLALMALALLVIGSARREDTVTRIGIAILIAAALVGLPVFMSGEPAEEVIEHLAGVQESTIDRHENTGKIALALLLGTGLIAAFGLVRHQGRPVSQGYSMVLTLAALVLAACMAWTAHTGGLIRHPEIAGKVVAAPEHED